MAATMEELNKAWAVATRLLTPGSQWISSNGSSSGLCSPETDFQSSVSTLCQNGMAALLEDWFFEEIQRGLRQQISVCFWDHFKSSDGTSCFDADNLLSAVEYLHKVAEGYQPCIQRLCSVPGDTMRNYSLLKLCGVTKPSEVLFTLFKAIVFCHEPQEFQTAVEAFYSQAFKVFHHVNGDTEEDEDHDDSAHCPGCEEDSDSCKCAAIMERFHNFNRKLDDLGILEHVSGSAVSALVHEQIQHHVESTCKGNFETAYLENMENWLESKVLGWLKLVYSGNRTHISNDCITGFKGRLLHYLYETYAKVRIGELFTIIIEYPESGPAVLDMKTCLEKTDMRGHLVSTLKASYESRLLHPGVNTGDILSAYISAIRALRALDPAGVILELVCEPVRKYMRSREDTVRSIISHLTDDSSNDLLEELVKHQPLIEEGSSCEEDHEDWEQWMPDPVDADPATAPKSRRGADIISMLVNIYGSKELFVNEYSTLLADRILTNFNYEIVREIRYLELLKLRFGESHLHSCEVMLKDVADSKRLNTRIAEERLQKGEVEDVEVNAMVLSAQFWPAFREEKVTLPAEMKALLEKYTKKFEALKGNRTLNWKSHLGLVNIDIELKDQTLNFNVSPVHAAIIMQFQEQERFTVEELSSILQVSASALRRRIAYWQTQGFLKEEVTDTFVLVEEHRGRTLDISMVEDEETESAMASAQVQREEELQMFWSYIVGMLSNLDSLSIERIHSMLRMFAMQGTSAMECSIQELKLFLDRKVKDQKLTCNGGVYRLPKAN